QRKDGSETCIVDVSAWDFNWQQFYLYESSDYLTTKAGDSMKLTCVYDNSPSNQPYIDNLQVQPKHVIWGEGTFDEMCLNYIIALSPWAEDKLCPTVAPCLSGCDPGDSECFVICLTQNGADCADCLLPQMGKCATKYCPVQMQALNQCLDSCSGESCLFEECSVQFNAAYICLEPHMTSGACDADLADCGVSLGSN
ncbi:MAG TPA: hypothetical protein EYN66_24695, partial [Myxococcales bacterium]|nr:hypothetical protein [Myxococcales bacterium]